MSEKEFIEIIQQHELIIHKVCNMYVHGKEDKKDLFQEIVLNAWKGIGQFRNESKFSTWLYRVALNTAMTAYRKEKKHSELIAEYPAFTITQAVEGEEYYAAMFKAVDELSVVEKALVTLYFDDYNYDEIATVLGITANNVAVKMNRIKSKLRESSKKYL